MSGLANIGGIVALSTVVWLAVFYIHRYLFEAQIKKTLSFKEVTEDDSENRS